MMMTMIVIVIMTMMISLVSTVMVIGQYFLHGFLFS